MCILANQWDYIHAKPSKYRTHRGKRSGLKTKSADFKIRPTQNGVNCHNLVKIKLQPSKAIDLANLALLNVRSLKNKACILHDHVVENNIDILGLTETWIKPYDSAVCANLTPNRYSFKNIHRPNQKGGGVGLLYKSNLDVKIHPENKLASFEHLLATFKTKANSFNLLVIYRPPNTSSFGQFLEEFTEIVIDIIASKKEVLIGGDFNIHLDNENDSETKQFNRLLTSLNLKAHFTASTHRAGHCLDNFITHASSSVIASTGIQDSFISDHFYLNISLNISKPRAIKKTVFSRKLGDIDIEKFQLDIESSGIANTLASDPTADTVVYNTKLKEILDNHAPVKERTIIIRPNTSWYNANIRKAKVIRRRFERKWNKSGLQSDKMLYKNQCKYVHFLINDAKPEFYSKRICESKEDKKGYLTLQNLF